LEFSAFGQRLAAQSGIADLMEDLGEALNVNPDILFLGGGNPAHIPALEQWSQAEIARISQEPAALRRLIGIYQSPQGDASTIEAVTRYLRKTCGWKIQEHNVALVGGSQIAFFILLNLFGGRTTQGVLRPISLPVTPEYLGYAGQALSGYPEDEVFQAVKPRLERLSEHRFKYHIDFEALTALPTPGAYCVSRPTNPTGNMLSDAEMAQLGELAYGQKVPLVVDCAYGLPFPGLVYNDAQPYWDSNSIVVMSLSKLGFPGMRTGIVVASEEVIDAVVRANTVLSLASGNLGPMLLERMLKQDVLTPLCRDSLRPFYLAQRNLMLEQLDRHLAGLPYVIHEPEGAMFVWLWFQDLPISSMELYQRLKARGVLVMAGEEFFLGLKEDWPHRRQCLRLTYCQDPAIITRAVAILAEEVRQVYG
jgi:valine--pyruvate aminotransferase